MVVTTPDAFEAKPRAYSPISLAFLLSIVFWDEAAAERYFAKGTTAQAETNARLERKLEAMVPPPLVAANRTECGQI